MKDMASRMYYDLLACTPRVGKLLKYPNKPAVIIVHAFIWFYIRDQVCNTSMCVCVCVCDNGVM